MLLRYWFSGEEISPVPPEDEAGGDLCLRLARQAGAIALAAVLVSTGVATQAAAAEGDEIVEQPVVTIVEEDAPPPLTVVGRSLSLPDPWQDVDGLPTFWLEEDWFLPGTIISPRVQILEQGADDERAPVLDDETYTPLLVVTDRTALSDFVDDEWEPESEAAPVLDEDAAPLLVVGAPRPTAVLWWSDEDTLPQIVDEDAAPAFSFPRERAVVRVWEEEDVLPQMVEDDGHVPLSVARGTLPAAPAWQEADELPGIRGDEEGWTPQAPVARRVAMLELGAEDEVVPQSAAALDEDGFFPTIVMLPRVLPWAALELDSFRRRTAVDVAVEDRTSSAATLVTRSPSSLTTVQPSPGATRSPALLVTESPEA